MILLPRVPAFLAAQNTARMQRCCSSISSQRFALATHSSKFVPGMRNGIHDIAITRTGKPILRIPGGGRSSIGGHTATVFGATGMLGRYIVNRLARSGCTVVVPYREEMAKRHLKVTGDLGRVVFMEWDLRNTPSIERSVRHSDIVFNLVGRSHTTKNFNYEDVHVEGAQRIAEAVAKYDVDRFIHVSSYNADKNSPSLFYATKAQGEEDVRAIFPETTIVRPAPMYGFEDKFLHKLAGVTSVFTANHMRQAMRPVHVIDVGKALEVLAYDDNTAGETFELYGPKEYTLKQIANMVDKNLSRTHRHINLPKRVYKAFASVLDYLWWPTVSPDEVEREFIDQKIDASAKTFKDLGIEPTDVGDDMLQYIRHYRSEAYFDLPPMTEKEKRQEKQYLHVQQDV